MSSLPSVTLDASILIVPDVNCGAEYAYQFVERLVSWSQLINKSAFTIVMSEKASESLATDNLFPLHSQLSALLSANNIVEYDAPTLNTIVTKLLTFTPTFESHFGMVDVLSEDLELCPDIRQFSSHFSIQSDLARCMTMIAVLQKFATVSCSSHLLVLRNAPTQVVRVTANIQFIEHSRNDMPTLTGGAESIEGEVKVCTDFQGLIKSLDESAILLAATDDRGVTFAIQAALFKEFEIQSEFSDWTQIKTPEIGREFRELCHQICAELGPATPNKILKSIIETVKGRNMSKVHALRRSGGGNEPQRLRGSDKAQRRDIDRDLHLHYWECADGTIELASVVHHDNMSIPY